MILFVCLRHTDEMHESDIRVFLIRFHADRCPVMLVGTEWC